MIDGRTLLVEKIFKHQNDTRIHIPINFRRIIDNIQHQFNLQNNTLVDINPYEL